MAKSLLLLAVACVAQPSKMRRVHTTGLLGCKAPFSCVEVESVDTPTPKNGEALIRVNATSVNPSDLDEIAGGLCHKGCGEDSSGHTSTYDMNLFLSKIHEHTSTPQLIYTSYSVMLSYF